MRRESRDELQGSTRTFIVTDHKPELDDKIKEHDSAITIFQPAGPCPRSCPRSCRIEFVPFIGCSLKEWGMSYKPRFYHHKSEFEGMIHDWGYHLQSTSCHRHSMAAVIMLQKHIFYNMYTVFVACFFSFFLFISSNIAMKCLLCLLYIRYAYRKSMGVEMFHLTF